MENYKTERLLIFSTNLFFPHSPIVPFYCLHSAPCWFVAFFSGKSIRINNTLQMVFDSMKKRYYQQSHMWISYYEIDTKISWNRCSICLFIFFVHFCLCHRSRQCHVVGFLGNMIHLKIEPILGNKTMCSKRWTMRWCTIPFHTMEKRERDKERMKVEKGRYTEQHVWENWVVTRKKKKSGFVAIVADFYSITSFPSNRGSQFRWNGKEGEREQRNIY